MKKRKISISVADTKGTIPQTLMRLSLWLSTCVQYCIYTYLQGSNPWRCRQERRGILRRCPGTEPAPGYPGSGSPPPCSCTESTPWTVHGGHSVHYTKVPRIRFTDSLLLHREYTLYLEVTVYTTPGYPGSGSPSPCSCTGSTPCT